VDDNYACSASRVFHVAIKMVPVSIEHKRSTVQYLENPTFTTDVGSLVGKNDPAAFIFEPVNGTKQDG
jgi:hypothetical protein